MAASRRLPNMLKLLRIFAPAAFCAVLTVPAFGHELWIAPFKYQFPAGQNIRADLRNGENLDGMQLAFFDRTSQRIEIAGPNGRQALTPRNGDRPAFDVKVSAPGLHVLAYESKLSRISYNEPEKWAKFVLFFLLLLLLLLPAKSSSPAAIALLSVGAKQEEEKGEDLFSFFSRDKSTEQLSLAFFLSRSLAARTSKLSETGEEGVLLLLRSASAHRHYQDRLSKAIDLLSPDPPLATQLNLWWAAALVVMRPQRFHFSLFPQQQQESFPFELPWMMMMSFVLLDPLFASQQTFFPSHTSSAGLNLQHVKRIALL